MQTSPFEQIRERIDEFDFRTVNPSIRFGTASDRYAGWIGQIYSEKWISSVSKRTRKLGGRAYEERTVPVASVEEYFEHFNALELDFTFYRPLVGPSKDPSNTFFVLQQYAESAPAEASFYLKAPQQVTARILRRGGGGPASYASNPDYLNQKVFMEGFLEPAVEILGSRLSGVIFEQEYQRKQDGIESGQNIDELNSFFTASNTATPVHIELRSPHLLTTPYFDWLADSGLGHVFSHWTWLPSIRDQWKRAGKRFTSGNRGVVCRLLTPLRMPYAIAYEHAHPFDSVVPELSETPQASRMVLDTAALAIQSLKHDHAVTIISNNRAWGNAPSLAQKVARRIVDELEKTDPDRVQPNPA